VLAIAIALMLAREKSAGELVAIDIDPIALENALANARLNGVERVIRFSSVPLTSIRRRFDLITANILSHTLIELAPHLKRILAPGGRLIISGFLADEANEVLNHYRPHLRCVSRRTHRGWTTLVLARAPRVEESR
jgi:ribosomal protein L11 methyltransferase